MECPKGNCSKWKLEIQFSQLDDKGSHLICEIIDDDGNIKTGRMAQDVFDHDTGFGGCGISIAEIPKVIEWMRTNL